MKSTCAALRLPPAASNCVVAHRLAAAQRELVGGAERDVARRVLVEERVVEETPGLRDRRAVRHQRELAEPRRAGIHRHQRAQHRLAALGGDLDDAPVDEGQLKFSISVPP